MKTDRTINARHYTYIHRCKDNVKRIFYVGKGSSGRMRSNFHRNPHWKSIVAKHGLVVEKVASWETHEEALEHEKFLIFCFKSMGIKLCNMTDGGEGVTGYKPTKEQREKTSKRMKGIVLSDEARLKISISKIGNKARLGHKNSDQHKEKIAAIWKGKKLSEEHKRKLSLAKVGRKLSEETKQNMAKAQKARWEKCKNQ